MAAGVTQITGCTTPKPEIAGAPGRSSSLRPVSPLPCAATAPKGPRAPSGALHIYYTRKARWPRPSFVPLSTEPEDVFGGFGLRLIGIYSCNKQGASCLRYSALQVMATEERGLAAPAECLRSVRTREYARAGEEGLTRGVDRSALPCSSSLN